MGDGYNQGALNSHETIYLGVGFTMFSTGKSKSMKNIFSDYFQRPTKKQHESHWCYRKTSVPKLYCHSFLFEENTDLLKPTLSTVAPNHTEIVPYLPRTCYTSIYEVLESPSTQYPLGKIFSLVRRKYNDPLTVTCAIELGKKGEL